MEHAQSNTEADDPARRRAICSAAPTKKVLLKIMGADLGLRYISPNAQRQRQIDSAPTTTNVTLGLRVDPYNRLGKTGKDDSGYLCVEDVCNVRLDDLVGQLLEAGYRYIGGHCKEDRGVTISTLEFALEGEAVPMEERVNKLALFGSTFIIARAFANPKNVPSGETFDTINCRLDRNGDYHSAKRLLTFGNLYEVR